MTQAIHSSNNAYCFRFCESDEGIPSRPGSRYNDITMVQNEPYSCSQGCYDGMNAIAYGLGMVIRAVVFVVAAPFVLIGMMFQAIYNGMVQACSGDRSSSSEESTDSNSAENRSRERNIHVRDEIPLLPLLRADVNAANIPLEAVNLGAQYRVNQARKNHAPDRIDWNAIFTAQSGNVQVRDLLNCFDDIAANCTASMPLTTRRGWTAERMKGLIKDGYVDFIQARNGNIYGNVVPREYYDQLSAVTRNLIIELRKPEILLSKKIEVLNELADAADKCHPRRLSEAVKQYRNITNIPQTMDNLARIWVQEYKIDIILKYFQNSGHMNVLNDARNVVRGWGLEDPDVMAHVDPYARNFGASSAAVYIARLEQDYTPACLISMVQAKIEFGDDKDAVNAYLLEKTDDGTLTDEELMRMYDGSNINYYGAAKILEFLGFLIPV